MPSLMIEIPQMIDLALGTAEVDVVNFKMLRSLLYVLVDILDADKYRVEFSQSQTEKFKKLTEYIPLKPTIAVQEFKVDRFEDGIPFGRRPLAKRKNRNFENLLLISDIDEIVANIETDDYQETEELIAMEEIDEVEEINAINDLTEDVILNKENLQVLNMNRRLDALETTIESISVRMKEISAECENRKSGSLKTHVPDPRESVEKNDQIIPDCTSDSSDQTESSPSLLSGKTTDNDESSSSNEKPTILLEPDSIIMPSSRQDSLRKEFESLKNIVQGTCRDCQIERDYLIAQTCACVGAASSKLTDRFEILESKLSCIDNKIIDVDSKLVDLATASLQADVTAVRDFYEKLAEYGSCVDQITERVSFLNTERIALAKSIDDMKQELKNLNNLKASKEEMNKLLSEKPDYPDLEKKLSIDEFNNVWKTLTYTLDDVRAKCKQETAILNDKLEEVYNEMKNKADKSEVVCLKEYVDTAMNEIRMILKEAGCMPEAAGIKGKYLRNIECISCDQNVVMRLNVPSQLPKGTPIPSSNTLKPFLVYKLDSIRNQMKDVHGHNMHHFEAATKLVSRYCGGSHTISTAQYRSQRSAKANTIQSRKECTALATSKQLEKQERPTEPKRITKAEKAETQKSAAATLLSKGEELTLKTIEYKKMLNECKLAQVKLKNLKDNIVEKSVKLKVSNEKSPDMSSSTDGKAKETIFDDNQDVLVLAFQAAMPTDSTEPVEQGTSDNFKAVKSDFAVVQFSENSNATSKQNILNKLHV